jgi:hypothetical protein
LFWFILKKKSFDFSLFLKVYDGIQGWPFIEEGSYKLLIESILSAEDRVNFLELSLFLFSFSLLFHFIELIINFLPNYIVLFIPLCRTMREMMMLVRHRHLLLPQLGQLGLPKEESGRVDGMKDQMMCECYK